jgi:glycosyltransferase involved in cell wall biosynthesis
VRILTITNMYPPHHLGGYELSCWDVMQRFEARGHEVAVLTTDMRLPGVDDGVPVERGGVHRTLHFYWEDHVLLSPSPVRRALIERHNQRVLRQTMRTFRPDIVSVWNMGAMSLGLLNAVESEGLPLLLSVCDDWLCYGPTLDAWMRMFRRRPLLGRVVGLATGVPTRLAGLDGASFCFVSEFTRTTAREAGWPAIGASTVVYSGIDRRDFPAAPPRQEAPGWRLLYVGRIDERKGISTLVRALARLPAEASLDVLGRGDEVHAAELRALANQLGVADRLNFDAVERARLAARYRAADVVVFPSEWEEPFGLVPVEAMACGTPVVATGVGGSGEFLVDGLNAVLFPAGDVEALAAAVRRVVTDEALRRRLARGGAATAAELDVDRLADVLEAWHVATATRFRDGRPPERPPIAERIRSAVALS